MHALFFALFVALVLPACGSDGGRADGGLDTAGGGAGGAAGSGGAGGGGGGAGSGAGGAAGGGGAAGADAGAPGDGGAALTPVDDCRSMGTNTADCPAGTTYDYRCPGGDGGAPASGCVRPTGGADVGMRWCCPGAFCSRSTVLSAVCASALPSQPNGYNCAAGATPAAGCSSQQANMYCCPG